MYSFTFRINGLPRTINSIGRKHWGAKTREANLWKHNVLWSTIDNKPPKPLKKAKLILKRVSTTAPDYDGLVSSFKHVVDGLIDAEIIEDDRMENIGMPEFIWTKGKRNKGFIEVTVIEVK